MDFAVFNRVIAAAQANAQAHHDTAAHADATPDSHSLTRRRLLAAGSIATVGAATLSAGIASPTRAQPAAQTTQPAAPKLGIQGGGFYTHNVGDLEVTVIADGNIVLGGIHPLVGRNVTAAEVEAEARADLAPIDQVTAQVNCLLIRAAGSTILVDTGLGPSAAPALGALRTHLPLVGLTPADIDMVFITHAHFDHIGGLLDGSSPAFPRARVLLAKAEHDFWLKATPNDLAKSGVPEANRPGMIQGAQNMINTLGNSLELLGDNATIVPGVKALALPGHTPGHTGVTITSGDRTLHFLGDAITHPTLSFRRPDFAFIYDADPDLAATTRKGLLEKLAATKGREQIATTHAGFPGIGVVVGDAGKFRFNPVDFSWRRG